VTHGVPLIDFAAGSGARRLRQFPIAGSIETNGLPADESLSGVGTHGVLEFDSGSRMNADELDVRRRS